MKKPKAVLVDFRDQRGIYTLYADYELVSIDQTGAGDDRLFKRHPPEAVMLKDYSWYFLKPRPVF